MTIPRYIALSQYWEKIPPVNVSVAAFLGAGKQKTAAAADQKRPTLDKFSQ